MPIDKLWTMSLRIRGVHCALLTKLPSQWCQSCSQREEMRSSWPPDEVKMSLWRDCEGVFETKNPAWCGQRGPKVVCHSSDKAFWKPFGLHFGRLWRLKRRHKMKSVSDILLGSKFCKKWSILVSNSNGIKMILYYKFCNAQSRFLNNSPTVLNGFCLFGNTSLLGFGSKNQLWTQAWQRYEFRMHLGSILGPKIIKIRTQNRFRRVPGGDSIFGTV